MLAASISETPPLNLEVLWARISNLLKRQAIVLATSTEAQYKMMAQREDHARQRIRQQQQQLTMLKEGKPVTIPTALSSSSSSTKNPNSTAITSSTHTGHSSDTTKLDNLGRSMTARSLDSRHSFVILDTFCLGKVKLVCYIYIYI